MKLFDVYPVNDINIVKAQGSYLWDENGTEYLDMYGGHAVISIGHTHPYWVKKIEQQLEQIAFYSNSIKIPIQQALADKLGMVSGKIITSYFFAIPVQKPTKMRLSWRLFITGAKK